MRLANKVVLFASALFSLVQSLEKVDLAILCLGPSILASEARMDIVYLPVFCAHFAKIKTAANHI